MRKLGVVAAIAATLTALGATSAQAGGQGGAADSAIAGLDSPDRIAGQYIVVLEDNARVSPAAATAERAFGAAVDNVYRSAIHGYSARMSEAAAERLAQAPAVKSV
jgi:hypothetical protein